MEKEEHMCEEKLNGPATVEWASLALILTKHDSIYRMCFDYCIPNVVAIRHTFALPRKNKCIDVLEDALVFTALDAS